MKRSVWIAGGLLALVTAAGAGVLCFTPAGPFLRNAPEVGAGYAAELTCAGIFVMGRDPDDVIRDDIRPANPLLKHAEISVDRDGKSVTASLFSLARRTALYRPGLGCTLAGKEGVQALRDQAVGVVPMEMRERPAPWPAGDKVETAETPELAKALDDAFADGSNTRAIIVVQAGKIVAERYAQGFDRATRFPGWSMAKSVTSALTGALVAEGRLSLDAPAPVPAWTDASDARHAITLRQLLTMSSGLHFKEYYLPGDDATTMLYRRDDTGAFAASQPLDHPPGAAWSYSSGTANIVSRLVFQAAGSTAAGTYDFARTHLFEPTGMTSAVMSPDATGSPVGSSYVSMTARDWARFGQLYLDGGRAGWQRVFSEAWTEESRRPAKLADGKPVAYGLSFWLNSDGTADTPLRFPDCPADTYFAEGHYGQFVGIVPSEHVVLVRLGQNPGEGAFNANRHFAAMMEALKARH